MSESIFGNSDAAVNQERENALDFLAREAKEIPQWKAIYQFKLDEFAISENEVKERMQRMTAARALVTRARRNVMKNNLVRLVPNRSSEDVVIYCWPYHAQAEDGSALGKVRKSDPITTIVTVLASVWLIGTVIALGMHFYTWTIFKGLPIILLPLLGSLKGTTHIRLNASGIIFESSSGKAILMKKETRWIDIDKIYVDMPKKSKSPLAGALVIRLFGGKKVKIALKKIASAEQWHNLVLAISKYKNVTALDPALLDGLNQGATRDPSYTRLWLDALSAPPKRERLQPLEPGVELQKGNYRIVRLLGTGGQGSAYLAAEGREQVVLKEYILPVYVDVKVKKQALEDFEHEAKILGSLHHKNIVRSLGSFIEDHRAYLILEYVEGKSLKEQVRETGALPQSTCIEYALQMCEILGYLHSLVPAVVHQDFTPDNLLIAPDGSLKLIDFMVAKQTAGETVTGLVVGKHHYMPPEQFRGKATARSDIYAFGCTLHYMLTGSEPEPMSTSHPILVNENVAGELNSIVEKATMLHQEQRYYSAGEISDDLKALQKHLLEQTL
jgi:tRNA A-37 threonylcarbamoyl transferase component Bud32